MLMILGNYKCACSLRHSLGLASPLNHVRTGRRSRRSRLSGPCALCVNCPTILSFKSGGFFVLTRTYADTFPDLVVGGVNSGDWVNVRRTNNYNTQAPVCAHTIRHRRLF